MSETVERVAQFRATAKDAGAKLTHQRIEIFREVVSSLEHPDAETVFRAVRTRMPTVSLDTVYRTLWMLNDLGLVSTLGSRRETVRFDANPKDPSLCHWIRRQHGEPASNREAKAIREEAGNQVPYTVTKQEASMLLDEELGKNGE